MERATARFGVPGLCCATEANEIRRGLARLEGVLRVRTDPLARRVQVDFDPGLQEEAGLSRALRDLGFPPAEGGRRPWAERHARLLTALSGLAAGLGLLAHLTTGLGPAAVALYGAAVAAGMATFARSSWASLRHLRPDMNLLMSLAIVAAVGIGEWAEAASVAFLFALAEELERASLRKAQKSIEALLDLEPLTARLRRGGETVELPVGEVEVDQEIQVRAGERIPLDGQVVEGTTSVDEAALTGESVPAPREPGDEVYAGTLNLEAPLVVRVTRPAGETTLDRVLQRVEEARTRSSPAQRLVDRFARVYTPLVLGLALLVLLVPPLLAGGSWSVWFYRALVLLVVSCPCALVLSTPVTVVSALAAAARGGVLVKGGRALEEAGRVRAVALDKTGTLTQGRFEVVEVLAAEGISEDRVLAAAAGLERHVEHPIARAIVEEAQERGLPPDDATEVESHPGRGARGRIDGEIWRVGGPAHIEAAGVALGDLASKVREAADQGHTVAALSREDRAVGLVLLRDRPRPEIARLGADLRRLGVREIHLLTGDAPGPAAAVAEKMGLPAEAVHAGLLPEEKQRRVEELAERFEHVAMVGDGVNDAPALAAASLGVAVGTAGSDVAMETADVALLGARLDKLADVLRLGQRSLRVIRFNVAAALLVKAVFVVLAVTGHATLWMAVGADMGASLLVIANGLRMLRARV